MKIFILSEASFVNGDVSSAAKAFADYEKAVEAMEEDMLSAFSCMGYEYNMNDVWDYMDDTEGSPDDFFIQHNCFLRVSGRYSFKIFEQVI